MLDVAIPPDEIVDPPARIASPEFPWWNRDQCRTPMAWTAAPGAGFTTGRPWIRIGDDAADRNLAAQEGDPDSVLSAYHRLIAFRRVGSGPAARNVRTTDAGAPDVLACERAAAGESIVVVVNFAPPTGGSPSAWPDASRATRRNAPRSGGARSETAS